MDQNPNAPVSTSDLQPSDLQLAGHLEFEEVAKTCPPGMNPVSTKPAKAVSKLYFVTTGIVPENDVMFDVMPGSRDGFRTLDEVKKFVKILEPGEYTLLAAYTKKIAVQDVRRVRGV